MVPSHLWQNVESPILCTSCEDNNSCSEFMSTTAMSCKKVHLPILWCLHSLCLFFYDAPWALEVMQSRIWSWLCHHPLFSVVWLAWGFCSSCHSWQLSKLWWRLSVALISNVNAAGSTVTILILLGLLWQECLTAWWLSSKQEGGQKDGQNAKTKAPTVWWVF